MEEKNEKRQQARMNLKGYTAAIADGKLIFSGLVDNISLGGLRLSEMPQKFELKNWKYTLVVSGGPGASSYRMTVFPCWRRKNNFSQEIGFKIAEAHAGWKSFIQKIMPKIGGGNE
jgi:hypothetical protein